MRCFKYQYEQGGSVISFYIIGPQISPLTAAMKKKLIRPERWRNKSKKLTIDQANLLKNADV
jgi:hypothetical protein